MNQSRIYKSAGEHRRDEGPPPVLNDVIARSEGTTPSEKYLAQLADKAFLNLWSYPNVFNDKKSSPNGNGKELCDLLIVCGNDVIIFSDKTIAWPNGDNINLSWSRWYKRAIQESVTQIRGAERWIRQHPDRVYLDAKCTKKLPIKLPEPDKINVHGIVVALGSGDACRSHFNGGSGSLLIRPDIKGSEHINDDILSPFYIGDVSPEGSFIHVFDDTTLELILTELDTISDFTQYLSKKAKFFRSGRLLAATGEEEVLAWYLTHINQTGEHDFTQHDGGPLKDNSYLTFSEGLYAEMLSNPQYHLKKEADSYSYVWDKLIESFTKNMLAGTTSTRGGEKFVLSNHEQGVRYMALQDRTARRGLGNGVLDALRRGQIINRFTRAFINQTSSKDKETGFFIMTFKVPNRDIGYDRYRALRANMLETYALNLLQRYDHLKRIIGISCEPPGHDGSSEDLIFVEPSENFWTAELIKDLGERKIVYDIGNSSNITEVRQQYNEYPEVPTVVTPVTKIQKLSTPLTKGLNRAARRKMARQLTKRK